jgi:hypothetical protein
VDLNVRKNGDGLMASFFASLSTSATPDAEIAGNIM